MKIETAADGRAVYTFRQSSLKDLDLCGERARRNMLGLDPARETDAAAVGTAMHAAAEACLAEHNDGQALTLSDTLEVWEQAFREIERLPNFVWVKYDPTSARKFGRLVTTYWYEQILPTIAPSADALLEEHFSLVMHEDAHEVVKLSGTIDYICGNDLRDWKTSGRKWQRWEHQRWDVQATAYTWAAHQLGHAELVRGVMPFEFDVMTKDGADRIIVTRTEADWTFLSDKVLSVLPLLKANLPVWAKNDAHVLCSETWCEAFSACKGRNGLKMQGA